MEKSTKTTLWVIGIVAGIIAIATIISNNSKTATNATYKTTYTTPTYTTKTQTTVPKVETKPTTVTWHCVDATSYNKNAYDDNRCTSSTGETRYVSDSQARALDPSYVPGTSGHPYYNSK